jgi:hypothetical protein
VVPVKRAIVVISIVAVAGGLLLLRKHREAASEPPWPPAICFPEPTTSTAHALDGDFEIFDRVKHLPQNIRPAFKEKNGSRWAIADPGKRYQEFDFITDGSLPIHRLVFAGRSKDMTFVHYEQGIRLAYVVAAFRTETRSVEPLWRRYCPRKARNLEDLRSLIAADECQTEAQFHQGFNCKDYGR